MSDSTLILPLIRRLQSFADLSPEETCALQEAAGPIRTYGSHQYLLHEREQAAEAYVIVSGFVCQQITLPNGRRQIVGYFLPGDMCTGHSFMFRNSDVTISTLAPTSIVPLARRALIDVTSRYPQLARALCWYTLVEEAIGHQWLINMGQRTALERLAHLFCEIQLRLQSVGHATPGGCELPLTQSELADTVALSSVHVNRTLKQLRRMGLVSMSGKALIFHDLLGLRALAMFDEAYLHLDGAGLISERFPLGVAAQGSGTVEQHEYIRDRPATNVMPQVRQCA